MSTDIRHRGRPRGSRRQEFSSWMSERTSFTMGELSRSLGWPLSAANKTLQRAKESGEVRIAGTQASPGVKRPVAVYEPAGASPAAALDRVMSLWKPGRTG